MNKRVLVYTIFPVALAVALCFPGLAEPGSRDNQSATSSTISSNGLEKLDVGLRELVKPQGTVRGAKADLGKLTKVQLKELLGVDDSSKSVEVAIEIAGDISKEVIERAGGKVRFQLSNTLYADVPVPSLLAIAKLKGVKSINGFANFHRPRLPDSAADPSTIRERSTRSTKFKAVDRRGRTGKGVIVAVLDSGIDWQHPDFIRDDGSSKILYLYDLYDTSWNDSGGAIGSRPPVMFDSRSGEPTGTLYTQAQINKALASNKLGHSSGTEIRSYDEHGHGTACAGTAAGNGLATANGVPPKTYLGLAPEADLIVVKGMTRNGSHVLLNQSTKWVIDTAKSLGRPCAINLSYGHQFGPHDGTLPADQLVNQLCGPGKPGVAICVAGGNDRAEVFHAGGRFGPLRLGQADADGSLSVEYTVLTEDGILEAYFDPRDHWRLDIIAEMPVFENAAGQKVNKLSIYKGTATIMDLLENAALMNWEQSWVRLASPLLPVGKYKLRASGRDGNVISGRYDFYIPLPDFAKFGRGNEARFMIGTPGLAENVITVGAYDDLSEWTNLNGITTRYNLTDGEISDYSCPGYRRDGLVKPDIAAPGTYSISSLARLRNGEYSEMGTYEKYRRFNITQDGYHLGWSGTSVAAPYVTGVVALMFEKNPQLDCSQIKEILRKTARKDSTTGGVPNRDFGYGKINPTAAIAACDNALASSKYW